MVLFIEDCVEIDSDILEMSDRGVECKVTIGERIGRVRNGSGN